MNCSGLGRCLSSPAVMLIIVGIHAYDCFVLCLLSPIEARDNRYYPHTLKRLQEEGWDKVISTYPISLSQYLNYLKSQLLFGQSVSSKKKEKVYNNIYNIIYIYYILYYNFSPSLFYLIKANCDLRYLRYWDKEHGNYDSWVNSFIILYI